MSLIKYIPDLIKYSPEEPRDDHGRWTSGGESSATEGKLTEHRKQLEGMLDRIRQPDGGFTYNPLNDEEAVKGYAVSPYPERSFAIDAKSITPDDVDEYVQKNLDQMSQPNHFIGAWHDPATGKAFLDVSVVVKTPEEAHALALKHDQKAYFDFQTFKSVEVNADATSGGVIKKGGSAWPNPLLRWSAPGPRA